MMDAAAILDLRRRGLPISAELKASMIDDLRELDGWIARARAYGDEKIEAIGEKRRAELLRGRK